MRNLVRLCVTSSKSPADIFNNGLGLVIIVNETDAGDIVSRLNAMGETAHIIGSVESRKKDEESVQFAD